MSIEIFYTSGTCGNSLSLSLSEHGADKVRLFEKQGRIIAQPATAANEARLNKYLESRSAYGGCNGPIKSVSRSNLSL